MKKIAANRNYRMVKEADDGDDDGEWPHCNDLDSCNQLLNNWKESYWKLEEEIKKLKVDVHNMKRQGCDPDKKGWY